MKSAVGELRVLQRPRLRFRTSTLQTTSWRQQSAFRFKSTAVSIPSVRTMADSAIRRGLLVWSAIVATVLFTKDLKSSGAFLALEGLPPHSTRELDVVRSAAKDDRAAGDFLGGDFSESIDAFISVLKTRSADVAQSIMQVQGSDVLEAFLQDPAQPVAPEAVAPEAIEPLAECEDVMQNETLFATGKDRWMRPTLVARPCMHQIGTREDSLKAVEGCMETVRQTLERLPSGENQILVLYDLGGAGYSNLDMVFTRELLQGLVQKFPDALSKVLVFNGHWSLRAAWSTVSRLLHPETREKVIFCNPDVLSEYVDSKHPYLQYLKQE